MDFMFMIKILYVVNGIFAVLLYVPQVMKVWKDKKNERPMSLLTFGGWCAGSGITTIYAWYYVHDLMFAALSFANMIGAGTIFFLTGSRYILLKRALAAKATKHYEMDFSTNYRFNDRART
jgi:uncharacterized protein with PQ loop repeat